MPDSTSRPSRLRAWGTPAIALVAGASLGVGGMILWGPSADPAGEVLAQGAPGAGEGGTQTLTVGLETLEESVSVSGTLAAVSSSALAFEAAGTVTDVYVEAGDTVAEGDPIAEIDTLQLTAALRSAESELAQAEATLSNLEDDADGSDTSDAQIASAEARVEVLEESVADAEEAMDDAVLVADIGGLVTAQPYAVGDVVSSGSGGSAGADAGAGGTTTTSSGVTIVGEDEWTVAVSLSEAEVAQIAEGDQVTFTADDYDGEFFGVVTEIANLPTTTGGSATYAVDLLVTGTVEGLYEGTSVEASIVTLRRTDVLAVPTNAITTADEVSTVTVVDDAGATEEREVTTGETIGSYTEIIDGLTEGEQLEVTVVTAAEGSGTGDFEDFMQGGEFPGGEFPGGGGGGFGGEMPGGGQAPGN
ncbi:efflux RND transporter periplasmic adaptor subunit [uncultured Demequina sp.]|uniref:efflux RND transporter periplasmic adaptor subunit n=1 Tax=uncultured Demequina sp. TaxID=693499 RepID=UPI0025DDEFEF|nr:biotin/lipoyl-binding protein [uncultured Demequina sp.]